MTLATSYHRQCVDAVAAGVAALGLAGVPGADPLPAAQVYTRILPVDRNVSLPAVLVTLAPLPETLEGTLANTDDVGYPVGVTLLVAKNQELTPDDAFLYWRQQVENYFHNRRPAAVASGLSVPLKICRWEPGSVIDGDVYQSANLWASGMVIRVVVRKTRT